MFLCKYMQFRLQEDRLPGLTTVTSVFAPEECAQGYKAIATDLQFPGETAVEILFLLLNMLRSRLSKP